VYSRREFLVRTIWLALVPTALRAAASQRIERATSIDFTPGDLEALAAAMDEIIPAGDGMPSASAAGGAQYIQYLGWQYPNIQKDVSGFLKTLAQMSVAEFRFDFSELDHERRVQVLAEMERTQASTFATFVRYVYESYYTNPRVFGRISCVPASVTPDDVEALLAPVRKLTHLVRVVP
jgi:Gluconate 2-dehydrogenase subunit 3